MTPWRENDHVLCPALGREGKILHLDGDYALVYCDDRVAFRAPLAELVKPEQINLLSDWTRCPDCGSERWHHLGDYEYKPTERTVDIAVLDEIPNTSFEAIKWHVEQGAERQRLIRRECRDCGHRFREDTGARDVTRHHQ